MLTQVIEFVKTPSPLSDHFHNPISGHERFLDGMRDLYAWSLRGVIR